MEAKLKAKKTKLSDQRSLIMVIDDDHFLLSVIRKKLELANYRVATSVDMEDAHFKLGIVRPDLVLLDVMMPEMNGLELLAEMRSKTSLQDIPVIIMSALSKENLMELGYDPVDSLYLEKPLDIEHLPDIVDKALNSGAALLKR